MDSGRDGGHDGVRTCHKGYFLHRGPAADPVDATFSVNFLDDPDARTVEMPFELGWNLVGVVDGGISAAAFGTGLHRVFGWDGTRYQAASFVRQFQGYWIFDAEVAATRPRIVTVQ